MNSVIAYYCLKLVLWYEVLYEILFGITSLIRLGTIWNKFSDSIK